MSRFSASRSGNQSQVDKTCPGCNGRLAPGKWGVWCPAKCGWRAPKGSTFSAVESPTEFKVLTTPSKEQVDIFDATLTSDENMVMIALAGTGKTTVLTNQAYHCKQRGLDVLCLAFTSRDRHALQGKIPTSIAKVWTSNGAGLGILSTYCRQNGRAFDLDKNGYLPRDLLKARFEGDGLIQQDGEWTAGARNLYGAVLTLVDKARTTMALAAKGFNGLPERPSDADWGLLADRFGVEVKGDQWPNAVLYASSLFREMADLKTLLKYGKMDHNGCVFLPVYHQLQPTKKYDRVLVDEAQDQSYVNRGIAELYREDRTGRIIAVGDRHQAIYAWRGADQFAMDEMVKLLASNGAKVETFPLTECRRCAKSIIEEAQKLVPDIKALRDAPTGEVDSLNDDDFIKELVAQRKGLVLCRQNAPVISLCLQLLSKSVPAMIARSNVIKDIETLIENAANGEGGDCPVIKVLEYVESWRLERTAKLAARQGTEDQIQVVTDKANCINALADCVGVQTASHLRAKINQIFPNGHELPDPETMVVFSTVHGAKGSEADTVYLYSPTSVKRTGSLWDAIWSDAVDRDNTLYVAITRAKFRLVYAGVAPTVSRFAKDSDYQPTEQPVDNVKVQPVPGTWTVGKKKTAKPVDLDEEEFVEERKEVKKSKAKPVSRPLAALQNAVSGFIERGESEAVVEVKASKAKPVKKPVKKKGFVVRVVKEVKKKKK